MAIYQMQDYVHERLLNCGASAQFGAAFVTEKPAILAPASSFHWEAQSASTNMKFWLMNFDGVLNIARWVGGSTIFPAKTGLISFQLNKSAARKYGPYSKDREVPLTALTSYTQFLQICQGE